MGVKIQLVNLSEMKEKIKESRNVVQDCVGVGVWEGIENR